MKAEFFSDLLLDLRNLDIGLLNARRDVNIILYLTSAHVVWCKNPIRLSFETEVIYSEFFFFSSRGHIYRYYVNNSGEKTR